MGERARARTVEIAEEGGFLELMDGTVSFFAVS